MGSPNLRSYYKAAILDQLQYWWSPPTAKTWSLLKLSLFPFNSHKLYLLALKLCLPTPALDLPTIKASLLAWQNSPLLHDQSLAAQAIAFPLLTLQLYTPDLHLNISQDTT